MYSLVFALYFLVQFYFPLFYFVIIIFTPQSTFLVLWYQHISSVIPHFHLSFIFFLLFTLTLSSLSLSLSRSLLGARGPCCAWPFTNLQCNVWYLFKCGFWWEKKMLMRRDKNVLYRCDWTPRHKKYWKKNFYWGFLVVCLFFLGSFHCTLLWNSGFLCNVILIHLCLYSYQYTPIIVSRHLRETQTWTPKQQWQVKKKATLTENTNW